ncbi:MAG TPA: serine hydrolase domain-containing protein [Caulobacteraceae bacterium]|jgi:CubicO group peptidase (beta-lactamase class C family)
MSTAASVPIDGVCDPRFAAVREAFAGNFAKHGEVGAAVAIFVGGRKVVDLWGGWADKARTRPWAEDTLVNFFSVGKAISATCVLHCVQRGLLDLDAPVTCWWPEFGAAGKDAITLRQLMSHRAGLTGLGDWLPAGTMYDWDRMVRAFERQAPWWTPDEDHGYHVNSFGYLLSEPVRRVTGVSLGTLLRQEIAGPLGADAYIGLPASEHSRAAEFIYPERPPPPPGETPTPPAPPTSGDPLMRMMAYSNPPGIGGGPHVNTARWREAEIPSTNGHGNARGVALIYNALLDGLIDETVLAEATREHSHGTDRILERPSRFGLGYQLTQTERPIGPNPHAFGHFGAGGSLGFCDPDAGVAFGYVMNHMGPRWQNPCNKSLIDAVYSSL